AGAEVEADSRRGPIRVPIQRRTVGATNCQESAVRFEICPTTIVPFSRPRNRGMLACQHGDQTRAAELFPASSRLASARPVASPEYSGPVAHEEKNSRRRYRRHTCKTSDIAPRRARISFRAANGAGTISRETQRKR